MSNNPWWESVGQPDSEDVVAAMMGVTRSAGESDGELRARWKRVIRAQSRNRQAVVAHV